MLKCQRCQKEVNVFIDGVCVECDKENQSPPFSILIPIKEENCTGYKPLYCFGAMRNFDNKINLSPDEYSEKILEIINKLMDDNEDDFKEKAIQLLAGFKKQFEVKIGRGETILIDEDDFYGFGRRGQLIF